MKSVEFIVRDAQIYSPFESGLKDEFGGFTFRGAKEYVRDENGKMEEIPIRIYEIVYKSLNLDSISEFANKFTDIKSPPIDIKIDGEPFSSTHEPLVKSNEFKTAASGWPDSFDVAIQTVIGPELHAVQDHFDMDSSDARGVRGTHYYRGFVNQGDNCLSVVTCCQDSAGNDAAALFAERLINDWSPKFIFLMGIAAGRRTKCQIGDVVTPRVVIDDTEGVIEAQKRLKRPRIYPPPHTMIQQLNNFRFNSVKPEWHSKLLSKTSNPVPPCGQEKEYEINVATLPNQHDAAIYSSDLLLRDSEYLEDQSHSTHQQIRIGEMEAAGFGTACNARDIPIPWFIVRGVSDFGDQFKNNDFHQWAAHSAASYLYILIKHGINMSIVNH